MALFALHELHPQGNIVGTFIEYGNLGGIATVVFEDELADWSQDFHF